jgi:branched-chain amino acid transport system permease protein
MVVVNAVLAMTFIMMLRTGLISLGIAAFWGVGAYASMVLTLKFGLSFWISLPASAMITGVIALLFGYLFIAKGSAGFSFILLTMVIGQLFPVTIGNIGYLGGWNGIGDIPAPDPIRIPFLPQIEFVSHVQYFYLALFLLIIAVLICNAFYSAWAGRAWRAIGLSPLLAESIGINRVRYQLLAFVLASIIAGLIGSFFANYQRFVIPGTYGMSVNINVQLYAILGGMSYATFGPLIGSVVMTFFPEVMRITKEIAPIFVGALLIVLMMYLPGGLLSLVDRRTLFMEWTASIRKAFELLVSKMSRAKKA